MRQVTEHQPTASEEKIAYILEGIAAGQAKAELSEQLGYKSQKCLDSYMRRQGYRWDAEKKTYELRPAPSSGEKLPEPPARVRQVLASLAESQIDVKSVASELGFEDHQALAQYMRSQGYTWNGDLKTYTYSGTAGEELSKATLQLVKGHGHSNRDVSTVSEQLEQMLPYLKTLLQGQTKTGSSKLPHYRVPGLAITKSVRLAHALVVLAERFCRDQGLSQREFFELALIETLEKYGEAEAVSALVK